VVKEFLLPARTAAQEVSEKPFKILSVSTKDRPLSPESSSYPPNIHKDVHRLGAALALEGRDRAWRPPPDTLGSIDSLTVASFNLHFGTDVQGEPYDVAEAVGRLDAAVVCLQEDWVPARATPGSGHDPVADLGRARGVAVHRAELCAAGRRADLGVSADGGPGRLCVSVLTALPLISYEVIALGRGPGDSVPRVAQVLLLRSPGGGSLRLVNTHLTCSVASPLQLWRLWRRLRADPVPTVIAGDLNMPALLARRCAGLTGLVRGATFPARQPVVQRDHVLVSAGILAGSGNVLPPAGSDHRPVRAQLDGLNGSHQA
jgi:endonuclease/exonuclease/phosphatase family metal-dependent hydrolase